MKKTLLLLVAVGLMGSVTTQATPFDTKVSSQQTRKPVASARPIHQTTYITNVAVTGSHIPLVVTKYGNDIHSNSSFIAYSQPQLNQTGQLNVGAQLVQRDPAITSFGAIRR